MKAVVDRLVQYPNRYQLTNVETGQVLGVFDFNEITGTVQQAGTEIDKELFDSIAADLAQIVKVKVNGTALVPDGEGFVNIEIDETPNIPLSQKGAAGGVAELDSSGKVPSSQLPDDVYDVLEYTSVSNFPAIGNDGKIYIAEDSNLQYRWNGSQYVVISSPLALGETPQTAYAGDKGKQNADDIAALTERVKELEEDDSGSLVNVVDTLPASGYINQLYRLGNDLYISDGTAILPTNGGLEVVSALPEVGEPNKIYRVGNDLYVAQMIA